MQHCRESYILPAIWIRMCWSNVTAYAEKRSLLQSIVLHFPLSISHSILSLCLQFPYIGCAQLPFFWKIPLEVLKFWQNSTLPSFNQTAEVTRLLQTTSTPCHYCQNHYICKEHYFSKRLTLDFMDGLNVCKGDKSEGENHHFVLHFIHRQMEKWRQREHTLSTLKWNCLLWATSQNKIWQ